MDEQAVQIVVPMAGDGQRFRDAHYETPKPLIPVAGLPMVVRAVRDLPPAGRVVFVVRDEHLRRHGIDRRLRRFFPDCRIVTVEGLTEGQACTVRLAANHLDLNRPVIVAACDNTHVYDRVALARRMNDPAVDGLVWTYRGEPRPALVAEQYGWVRVDGQRVTDVSCKVPISDSPLEDHVVSGFFSFRRAGEMVEAIDRMVADDIRTRGEFYMDCVPNVMIGRGMHVEVFEVDKYIGWGTPGDLEDFCRWETYFRSAARAPSTSIDDRFEGVHHAV